MRGLPFEGERSPRQRSPLLDLALVAVCAVLLLGVTAVALARPLGGGPDDDRLRGTTRSDRIAGKGGDDVIRGRGSADTLLGGGGGDLISGGRGSDEINAVGGKPRGGRGADRIRARDRSPDLIHCGPGRDVAIVDAVEEGVYDCERVLEPKGDDE